MIEQNLLWKWMSRRPNGRKLDREKASNLSFKEAIMESSRATIWTWKMAKTGGSKRVRNLYTYVVHLQNIR